VYPQQELIQLAARKTALRRDIAHSRAQCVAAAVRLARPLAWLDRVLAFGRRLAPVAAVPLGFLAARTIFSRMKFFGALVRWSPLVFSVVRGLGAAVKSRRKPVPSAAGRH
jgi:hypothetical protein